MSNDLLNAVQVGAAFCIENNIGHFFICDEDQVDFLQRQTTNDINKLQTEKYVQTVLTTAVGRIVDVLTVFKNDDCLEIITLPEKGASTTTFLQKKIFFTDRVSIRDVSNGSVQIRVIGKEAEAIIEKLIHRAETPIFSFSLFEERRIVFSKDLLENITKSLLDLGGKQMDAASFDVLRVERGIPGHKQELTDEYSPLEVGLRHLISETKGCYTGQEVIARQINYGKIPKQLYQLRLSGPVEVGEKVVYLDKPLGVITSVAESNRYGWIGLAVLRTGSVDEGDRVHVTGETGELIKLFNK